MAEFAARPSTRYLVLTRASPMVTRAAANSFAGANYELQLP
jgi:hypothetical protein